MSLESPARFEIGKVLARSVATLRERWLTLAALVLGLHFVPSLAVSLTTGRNPRPASHDVGALAIYAIVGLGPPLLRCFSNAAVASASLSRTRTIVSAPFSVFRALPALLPIWLATEYWTILGLVGVWAYVTDQWPSHGGPSFTTILLSMSFVTMVVDLTAVAALGVLTPVVLAERRSLPSAVARTWRLMRGARWKVLALYILVFAALVAASFASFGIYRAVPRGGATALSDAINWTLTALLDGVGAFWSVLAASSYLELRRVAEGEPLDEVAETFA